MAESAIDVTVIIAVRNGAPTLKQCIESVLTQRGCNVEILVVDAMSDDGTQEIVESYGDRIATYIREPDRGIYDAWNKALSVTLGEWCAFLGADDYFLTETSLAALVGTAGEAEPIPVFVYGGILRIGAAEDYVIHPKPTDVRAYLRSGRMLPHPGSLHRVDALLGIGGFDASFQIAGDLDALIRMTMTQNVRRCSTVVTAMGTNGVSASWALSGVLCSERHRIVSEHSNALRAGALWVSWRLPALLGRGFERSVLAAAGPIAGKAMLLALRRALGRAPKLLT